MTLEVEVEEEKESGFFEGGGFRDFLESWQDYTNAFEREIRKWDSERIPELRKDMARIKEELAHRSKDSAQKAKTLLRGILRRV